MRYRFGGRSFLWKAALFDNCLPSALRSLREALERAKCSPAVCLRPKKGELQNTLLGQQEGKTAGHPQNTKLPSRFPSMVAPSPALPLSSFLRSFFTRRASSLKDHAQMHAFFERAGKTKLCLNGANVSCVHHIAGVAAGQEEALRVVVGQKSFL